MTTKIVIYKRDILCQTETLLLNILKLFKIPNYFQVKKNLKFQVFQGFQVKSQL